MLKFFFLFLLCVSSSLFSQTYIPTDLEKDAVKAEGWNKFLGVSLFGSMNDNANVVGKDDGTSTTLGLQVGGALGFRELADEWRNTLNLMVTYSRSPQLPEYIKTEDSLSYDSIYLFHLEQIPWAGPYARFSLDTSVLAGYDSRSEDNEYVIINRDKPTSEIADRLFLTDPFRPIRLKESVGGFAQPLNYRLASLEFRTGVGFRQFIAEEQKALADDEDTPEIEVRELENYSKAGIEFGSEIYGYTKEKTFSYRLAGDILFPFYDSTEGDNNRTVFDRRIVDVRGKASFHVFKYTSLDYLVKAIRDRDVTDKTQLSQTLLLSFNKVLLK